jgi:pyrophosphatase PpaX
MDICEEEILQSFGEPLLTTLERYSVEKSEEMFETYITFNESIHDDYVLIFDGVKECLEELSALGCIMAVVTSKRGKVANRGLELFHIQKYFDYVVAFEDTDKHKPEADPILKALELLGADRENSLMIGDSIFDMQSAKNAGVKSVLVKWSAADGYQGNDTMVDYAVSKMSEIVEIVKTS